MGSPLRVAGVYRHFFSVATAGTPKGAIGEETISVPPTRPLLSTRARTTTVPFAGRAPRGYSIERDDSNRGWCDSRSDFDGPVFKP